MGCGGGRCGGNSRWQEPHLARAELEGQGVRLRGRVGRGGMHPLLEVIAVRLFRLHTLLLILGLLGINGLVV